MPELLPKNPAKRKKLLIYGGLAGALLLIIMLSRGRGGDGGGGVPAEEPLTPVASPAASDAGLGDMGGLGVDNGSELAAFQSALLDQLPAAVESGVAAGLANGVAPPAQPAGGSTVININPGPGRPNQTATPTRHPAAGRLFAGHPLKWWKNPKTASKVVRGKRRWAWPSAPNKYTHTRPFAGRA